MRKLPLPTLTLLCTGLAAQVPVLEATPAITGNAQLVTRLSGPPRASFLTLVDVEAGPVRAFGLDIYLGLGATTMVLDAGRLDAQGGRVQAYRVPAAWSAGLPLFLQSVVADPSAPNGMFRVSDGEATVHFAGFTGRVIAETFDKLAGFSGDFDRQVAGRLMAGKVTRRLQVFPDPKANIAAFGQPLAGELDHRGIRSQRVYRRSDLGGKGQAEVLTGMWFETFQKGPVLRHRMQRVVLELAHSKVVPDFTVDPWSAFPAFPNSGLAAQFAQNIHAQSAVRVHDGPMQIDPQQLRVHGTRRYVAYPMAGSSFVYNGSDSLLIDVKHYQDTVPTRTGQQAYLMVLSSPRPDARVFSAPTADPQRVSTALRGDNTMIGMLFEFSDVFSAATSPWRAAPTATANYDAPVLGASVPPGASLQVQFQGADGAQGQNATAWSTDVNTADGRAFLRYRVEFRAANDGRRPSLDTLVIPVR